MIELCGDKIEWVKKMKYLGIWFNQNNTNKDHLQERRIKMWRAYFSIKKEIGLEGKDIKPLLKAHLIKTFIRPIAYYGLENISMSETDIKKMQKMENNMIKRTLNISARTRSKNLLYAMSIEPVEIKLKMLKLKFVKRILANEFTKKIFLSNKHNDENNNFVKEACLSLNISIKDEIEASYFKREIKNLEKKKIEESGNGICDSIKLCLSDLPRNQDLLKLLVRAF